MGRCKARGLGARLAEVRSQQQQDFIEMHLRSTNFPIGVHIAANDLIQEGSVEVFWMVFSNYAVLCL